MIDDEQIKRLLALQPIKETDAQGCEYTVAVPWRRILSNMLVGDALPADDVIACGARPYVTLCTDCDSAYRNGIEPGESACDVRWDDA